MTEPKKNIYSPRYVKQKGMAFQKKIAEWLEGAFNAKFHRTTAGVKGIDVYTDNDYCGWDFDVECKHGKSVNVFRKFEQAQKNCRENRKPMFVFKGDHGDELCTLKFVDLLQLINKPPKIDKFKIVEK